ncbi:MAG: response regulator [Proteobacteria bacterium]|jgi:signal transduction histidine kinase/DNA-binding response OmpR family regulator|nr:response regulator [Desulfocapsa sp.]MBU3945150.1 response regulator [Pseudomonadota bacterium]MCG2745820.1 response regulator [Desulfobacteraceae bacterium]MBU3982928.1 response regulator [Pseudomonadota bacterium]MBU4028042.1 response regulator [Pseudomonadota bacterium]
MQPSQLINSDEVIVVVDDSQDIFILFQDFLSREGYTVLHAATAAEFLQLLHSRKVALALLDIELPDRKGTELLADLARHYPDTSIIMITGTEDLQTALFCLRLGADDYLTKPMHLADFNHAVNTTLEKRRLVIDNRLYQKKLEATNFRTQFLHQLNLKMNTAYLSSVELDDVLQAILVGITASEGLQFNRAFLALFDLEHQVLQGRLAIGPSSREEAGRVWEDLKIKNMNLNDIILNFKLSLSDSNQEVNRIIKKFSIPVTDQDHTLIRACAERKSILVQNGMAQDVPVSTQLFELLQNDTFIIVPLFSPSQSLGVLIADNFITLRPICDDDIADLEIFASQASLAIEHSYLYTKMLFKMHELEAVTQELEKNKDLLVDAERYTALGHMSAQLVHAIRNPITSIGGTARLLTRKVTDPDILKFLGIMAQDATKIESTLEDLFNFVTENKAQKNNQPLYPLIRKSVMLLYGAMKKQGISYQLNLHEPGPSLYLDAQMIRQMLLHLIRNGIEAMPNGGLLNVSVKQDPTSVSILITDSGAGIINGNMAKVADPFFTTKIYGTGMGLTLVKKIVVEHQGTFSLQAGASCGTVATVTLPINNEMHPSE